MHGSHRNIKAVTGHTMTLGETSGDTAVEAWKEFRKADNLTDTRRHFSQICQALSIQQGRGRHTYTLLQARLGDGESKKLWSILDKRAGMKEYEGGQAVEGKKVLVIGAGPCGLRMAIESALLGAETVVVEARETISRNNVLHLWQFVIQDLKNIGLKFFWPKFAVGSLDHVSIRRLQLCLLKLVLILGCELHCPVSYVSYMEPNPDAGTGWRVELNPASCPAAQYDYDCIVGADGKRNSLPGYERKLLRGKLAIAITANFVNRGSRSDSRVQEIGGLFYVFAQQFFNELRQKTGVELENFVYYKDETHYFVMTPTKKSLIKLGVLKQDFPGEPKKLLAKENVDREKMLYFSQLIAQESTSHQLHDLEFAQNHHGEEDVAIFDFTAMYQAVNSCYAQQRHGHKLLTAIVGDTLIEPFWPTGSGCARGFLGVFDAAWLLKHWFSASRNELQVIAERENVYQLLSQSSPNNLKKPYSKHSINPTTRYSTPIPSMHTAATVMSLYASDVPVSPGHVPPQKPSVPSIPAPAPGARKRQRGASLDTHRLRQWYSGRLSEYRDIVTITDLDRSWRDGLALCAIVQLYRPAAVNVRSLDPKKRRQNVALGLGHVEREFGVSPYLSAEEWSSRPDKLAMLSYLAQLQEVLEEEEIAGGKMPRLDLVSAGAGASGGVSSDVRHHPSTATLERQAAIKLINTVSKKQSAVPVTEAGEDGGKRHYVGRARGSGVYDNNIQLYAELHKSSKLLKLTRKKESSSQHPASSSHPSPSSPSSSTGAPVRRDSGKKQYVGTAHEPRLTRKHAMRKVTGNSNKSPTIPQTQSVTDDMKNMSLARNACAGVAGSKIQQWQQQQRQADPLARNTKNPRLQSQSFLACKDRARRQNAAATEDETDAAARKEDIVDSARKEDIVDSAYKEDVMDESDSSSSEQPGSDVCCVCGGALYIVHRNTAHGLFFHRDCFRCSTCTTHLRLGTSHVHKDMHGKPHFYCFTHAYEAGAVQWSPSSNEREQQMENEEEEDGRELELVKEEEDTEERSEDTTDTWMDGGNDGEEEEEETESSQSESDEEEEEEEEEEESEEEEEDKPSVPHFLPTPTPSPSSTMKKTSTLPKTLSRLKNTISTKLLQADQIQRGFDELEEEGTHLDRHGQQIEERIRRNDGAASDALLDEWLDILSKKQQLKDRETELMLRVKLSELEDQHMKLQIQIQIAASTDDLDTDDPGMDLDQLEKETADLEADMNTVLSQLQELQVYVKESTSSNA